MQDNTNALLLLEQARGLIESNVFTRFFARPVLVFLEIVAYIAIPLSAWLALGLWAAMAELSNDVMDSTWCHNFKSETSAEDIVNGLNLLTLLIAVLLPITIFLIARLITASRRRLGVFREVEVLVEEAMGEMRGRNDSFTIA